MIDLHSLTITKAHEALKRGDFSAVQLAEEYLKVITEKNKTINAYLEVFDDVIEQAKKADEMFANGTATILTGIPIALKDNILVKGRKVSASSKILENYIATYDSTVAKKLIAMGAVILGRTNCDEFAMGASTENSAFGVTKNPHNTSRVAGGSSGGSAAALAMDGCLIALGSDTGGSIRQPAGFCGVIGFKPTYGTVSRYGLIAMASSLDIIGPFAKSVDDAEIVYNAIATYDPLDSTSIPLQTRKVENQMKKKLGVPRAFLKGIDSEVEARFNESIEKYKYAGYEVVDVEIPYIEYALPVYYIIQPAEASTNLSRFDGIRFGLSVDGASVDDAYKKTRSTGLGPEVKRRIMLGTYVLSHGYYDAYYNKAVKLRTKITESFKKVFESVDAIITPTSPSPAFKIGEKTDPVQMYLADIFTVSANIAGIPAISIPSGKNSDGLPLDLQIMAPHFCEKNLFTIARDIESFE